MLELQLARQDASQMKFTIANKDYEIMFLQQRLDHYLDEEHSFGLAKLVKATFEGESPF